MDINSIKELLKEQNNTRNFSHIYTKSGETIKAGFLELYTKSIFPSK